METSHVDFAKHAESMGNEFLESIFLTRTVIYVDLDYFFDFRLTALLCLMTDEDYSIISDNLDAYNNRTCVSTTASFPGISIQEDRIDEFLMNIPDMSLYAERLQSTDYFVMFTELLKGWNVRNKLAGSKNPIILVIGRKGDTLPKHHYDILQSYITARIVDIKLKFSAGGLTTQSKEFLDTVNHISVTDLRDFTSSTIFGPLIESGAVIGKSIHTPPRIFEKDETKPDADLLNNTNDYFNTYFDFDYIAARITHGQ